MTTQTIVTVIAAVVGPLSAYLMAARRFSGKIESSDAASLWRESASIREWSAGRIAELGQIIQGLEKRVRELEAHNGDLITLNNRLAKELKECQDNRT